MSEMLIQLENCLICVQLNKVLGFSYSNIRRQGNSVTHNLISHVRHDSSFLVWMEDISSHLSVVILTGLTYFA